MFFAFPIRGKWWLLTNLHSICMICEPTLAPTFHLSGIFLSAYENVDMGSFKDPSLMGTFAFPLSNTSKLKEHINIISLITYGSLISYDPWVVPSPIKLDS